MSADDNIQTIQAVYEAFGRGDVQAFLDQVTDDVDWATETLSTAAPWWGVRRGKAAVAQFFKDTLGDRLSEYAPAAAVSPGSGSHPRITTGSGDVAPNDGRSSARLAGSVGSVGTGSGSRPNLTASRPGTGSGPRANPNLTPSAKSGSGPRPRPPAQPAQAAGAEGQGGLEAEPIEPVKVRQATGQHSRPSQ